MGDEATERLTIGSYNLDEMLRVTHYLILAHAIDGKDDGPCSRLTVDQLAVIVRAMPANRYPDIIAYRFGIDGMRTHTLEETAKHCTPQVTRERVRQREARALEYLRARVIETVNAAL